MKSSRRKFFRRAGAGMTGLFVASSFPALGIRHGHESDASQVLFVGDDIAVAETTYGRVRGNLLNDIFYFLGIPYGADTSGANRFKPPVKPEPWNTTFPALWWGNGAPQLIEGIYSGNNIYRAFRHHANFDDLSENCLTVNVFTPGYKDGRKRPVLLWMHGGSWNYGISHEHDGVIGENLARFGDIVFCSINHRLGPFGFTDLSSAGGEDFALSGNVGALDLVAALQWIRDNISNFGGDPANVTIIGQSGGGGKVVTTTAMPSAAGLFHKAVALSAASIEMRDPGIKKTIGEYIMKAAGLKYGEISPLQALPWKEYYSLALKSCQRFLDEKNIRDTSAIQMFQPQVDGFVLPQHPFHPVMAPTASAIPMIFSSTTNENSDAFRDTSLESITWEEVKQKLGVMYGEKTGEIVDAYANIFSGKKPVEIWSMISSKFRQGSVVLADAKSKQPAPVWLAWFGWQPPLFDNRMRAFHTIDQCFWFYNTDLMLTHTGGGARPRALSHKMASSLVRFMNTGDPNGGGLPEWPRYSVDKGETLFLDDVCELQFNPDGKARSLLPPYIG